MSLCKKAQLKVQRVKPGAGKLEKERDRKTHPWRNSVNDFGNKREVPSVIKTFDYSCVKNASRVNLKAPAKEREQKKKTSCIGETIIRALAETAFAFIKPQARKTPEKKNLFSNEVTFFPSVLK